MKSLLVLTGGAASDEAVFETALAAARPFGAHLNFFHVYVGAGQAAVHSPHTDFASGPGLSQALAQLETEAKSRLAAAKDHVTAFCARSGIVMSDTPAASDQVTASWREEQNDALQRLIFHGRHNDLVVAARARKPNGLPSDFLELLLLDCGRPLLIAGGPPRPSVTGTIMVCWRETADAARAVAAAAPLLRKAGRLVIASVADKNSDAPEVMADISRQFAWSGVPVETKIIVSDGRPPQAQLAAAAAALQADLIVMGAYGHSRMREVLFGGFTQSFINDADRPVLMMH